MVEGFRSGSPIKSLSLLLLAWISPAAVEGIMAKFEVLPGFVRSRRRLSLMPRAEGVPRFAVVLDRTMNRSATTGMPTRSRMVVLLSMREVPSCLIIRGSNKIVKLKTVNGPKTLNVRV